MSESQEPRVLRVELSMCELCLRGDGGVCHVPGCALWMKQAPDVPVDFHLVDPEAPSSHEVECLREAFIALLDAHVEIIDGQGLPEDISEDAIKGMALALARKEVG